MNCQKCLRDGKKMKLRELNYGRGGNCHIENYVYCPSCDQMFKVKMEVQG